MTNYIKLLNNLENLELGNIKSNIDHYIKLVNTNEMSVVDAFYQLSELEIKAKRERAMNACVKVANFPFLKTIDDFDFDFQASVSKQQLLDLCSLRFIERTENIIFVGTPGVGNYRKFYVIERFLMNA